MSAPAIERGERLIALSIDDDVPEQTKARLHERNINVETIGVDKFLSDDVRPNPHAAVFTLSERRFHLRLPVLLRSIPVLIARGVLVFVRFEHRAGMGSDLATQETYRRIREGMVFHVEHQLRRAQAPHIRLSRTRTNRPTGQAAIHLPCVVLCETLRSWAGIADFMERNIFRESPFRALEVTVREGGKPSKLDEEDDLLVRRAFADCSNVTMERMQDGLSGQAVYRCHAELRQGGLGAWPFTTLVKIGPRATVVDEIDHYKSYVMTYIPYHLSPRLIEPRCALGYKRGVLVADFVSPSEPIRTIAHAARADMAITSLFTKTLSAWRYVAHRAERKKEGINKLLMAWPNFRDPVYPNTWPCQKLVKQFGGGRRSLHELHAAFEQLNGGADTLVGPIHGDLHASNVLVRGGDAIVIDLGNIRQEGPMLFDVASLEAGLLIEGFAKDPRMENATGRRAWFKSMKQLYQVRVVGRWTEPCAPHDGSSWFFDCVRQLRTYALEAQCAKHQYAIALAFCLIRKGCNTHPFGRPDTYLRAAALALGEYLLDDLEKTMKSKSTNRAA